MNDLSWVQQTKVVNYGKHRQYEDDPQWCLLLVTGGLYTPIEYVYGKKAENVVCK